MELAMEIATGQIDAIDLERIKQTMTPAEQHEHWVEVTPRTAEDALSYGNRVLPRLTEALNSKLQNNQLYPQMVFITKPELQRPAVKWGVISGNTGMLFGTIAAMQTIQVEALAVGYSSDLQFNGPFESRDPRDLMVRSWVRLAITNPELQIQKAS